MTEIAWLRPLKGFLIFVTFMGIGLSIQYQPSIGVVEQLRWLGIANTVVALAFYISAVVSLLTGIRRWNWNAAWISVFIFYTVMAWVSVYRSQGVPFSAPLAYTLLSAFLTLDVISDIVWGRNGRFNKKW